MANRASLPLLICHLSKTSSVYAENNEWDGLLRDWGGLAKDLVGFFFAYAGISALLYSHIATHKLWIKYNDERYATKVSGDVLSSVPHSNTHQYQVSVIYTTAVHKYENDSRNNFRHPTAFESKRFLRQFLLDRPIQRGTTIDVFVLRGMPRSGCLREVINRNIWNHSHCRTFLILMPGGALVGVFIYLAVLEVNAMGEHQTMGWIVFAAGLLIILIGTNIWCQRRFQRELGITFQGAVPQRIVAPSRGTNDRHLAGSSDRSEPLLPASESTHAVRIRGPLFRKGMDVSYKSSSGASVVPARILDVHLDELLEPYYTIQLEGGREKQTDNAHIMIGSIASS